MRGRWAALARVARVLPDRFAGLVAHFEAALG